MIIDPENSARGNLIARIKYSHKHMRDFNSFPLDMKSLMDEDDSFQYREELWDLIDGIEEMYATVKFDERTNFSPEEAEFVRDCLEKMIYYSELP